MKERELDALVAEKVMGVKKYWTVMFGGSHYGNCFSLEEAGARAVEVQGDYKARIIPYYDEPNYSTDISAAWEVVEKMRERGWKWKISSHRTAPWRVTCNEHEGYSENPAQAICKAALAAVGAKP